MRLWVDWNQGGKKIPNTWDFHPYRPNRCLYKDGLYIPAAPMTIPHIPDIGAGMALWWHDVRMGQMLPTLRLTSPMVDRCSLRPSTTGIGHFIRSVWHCQFLRSLRCIVLSTGQTLSDIAIFFTAAALSTTCINSYAQVNMPIILGASLRSVRDMMGHFANAQCDIANNFYRCFAVLNTTGIGGTSLRSVWHLPIIFTGASPCSARQA